MKRAGMPIAIVFLGVLCALPVAALASGGGGGGGHGFSLKEHGFYVLDFAIFVALLVFFVRKPLSKALQDRADRMQSSLSSAASALARADGELSAAKTRTGQLDADVKEMTQRLEEDAETLRRTIAERAVLEKEKIHASVQAALDSEKVRLEKALQQEVALAALDHAQARLAADWKKLDHPRLVQEFEAGVAAPLKPATESK